MAKEFAYTVRGHWPFPTDMLRHDGSRAATSDDQAVIDRLSGEFAPDRGAFEDAEVKLIGSWKPNTARWESFGWSVPADVEHQIWKGWHQKENERRALIETALAKLTPDEKAALNLPKGPANG
ncbi:hypothetical protein ACWIGM_09160 [Bosea sp. NPDC055332]